MYRLHSDTIKQTETEQPNTPNYIKNEKYHIRIKNTF